MKITWHHHKIDLVIVSLAFRADGKRVVMFLEKMKAQASLLGFFSSPPWIIMFRWVTGNILTIANSIPNSNIQSFGKTPLKCFLIEQTFLKRQFGSVFFFQRWESTAACYITWTITNQQTQKFVLLHYFSVLSPNKTASQGVFHYLQLLLLMDIAFFV